jgi:hypothetical protein
MNVTEVALLVGYVVLQRFFVNLTLVEDLLERPRLLVMLDELALLVAVQARGRQEAHVSTWVSDQLAQLLPPSLGKINPRVGYERLLAREGQLVAVSLGLLAEVAYSEAGMARGRV